MARLAVKRLILTLLTGAPRLRHFKQGRHQTVGFGDFAQYPVAKGDQAGHAGAFARIDQEKRPADFDPRAERYRQTPGADIVKRERGLCQQQAGPLDRRVERVVGDAEAQTAFGLASPVAGLIEKISPGIGRALTAAVHLIERVGGVVAGGACIIELSFLGGRDRVGVPLVSLIDYDS